MKKMFTMCCFSKPKFFHHNDMFLNVNQSHGATNDSGLGVCRSSSSGLSLRHKISSNLIKSFEKESRRRSKLIDKELKRINKIYKSTIKLLLLGTGESGKSTILKQMRIIHVSKFTTREKNEKIYDIKSNIRDSILSILEAMERLGIKLENESLNDMKEYIFENIHLFTLNNINTSTCDQNNNKSNNHNINNNFLYSNSNNSNSSANMLTQNSTTLDFKSQKELNEKIEKLWDCIEKLWKDNGVKKCAKRGNEYHLIDSAEYFMNKITIIRHKDYLPDEQDILR
jgi:hypothetical protein